MLKRAVVVVSALVVVLGGYSLGFLPKLTAQTVPPVSATAPVGNPTPVASKPWQRPALVKYALIISVDGLRPDLLLRGNTPNMHQLLTTSSFTMWARTTAVSITLPSHVSMLTGVKPERHGVLWNGDLPPEKQEYPKVPTIFEAAKAQGLTTGMASGKSKFIAMTKGNAIDWVFLSKTTAHDSEVAIAASSIIKEHKPNLMFVHFPGVDSAGHGAGWSSKQQMTAIAEADTALGVVLEAYKAANLYDQTLILLSADHGGQGGGHGPNDARSLHIPWIVTGPGIRKAFDLTINGELNVNTEDTFATTCYLLGLPVDRGIDGKPVLQILSNPELMVDK